MLREEPGKHWLWEEGRTQAQARPGLSSHPLIARADTKCWDSWNTLLL